MFEKIMNFPFELIGFNRNNRINAYADDNKTSAMLWLECQGMRKRI